MTVLLVLLSLTIGAYTYLTNGDHVRLMAEGYLSNLLGGRVEIGKATLSIFEGFHIENVTIYVDRNADKPDSKIFSAQAFVLNYDPRKMLTGQLEASEIIAEKPQVFLTVTHTSAGDEWNFQRIGRPSRGDRQRPRAEPGKLLLPSFLLRNAVIEIGEVRRGQCRVSGAMNIDGHLSPDPDVEHYDFALQTRGISEGLGPWAEGRIGIDNGRVEAHLHNVQIGDDLRHLFPSDLRQWWERHELSGRIEQVDVAYSPPRRGVPRQFSIATRLNGVTLAVHREEWSSRQDVAHWQRLRDAVAIVREPYRAAGFGEPGFRVQGSGTGGAATSSPNPEPRTLNRASPYALLSELVDSSPVLLREVTGSFVFTQDGIDVPDLLVRVGAGDPDAPRRSNAFRIHGHVQSYRPDAPLDLEVETADPQGIYFPAHPTFMESLPVEVRLMYQELQPEGRCRITASVNRPGPGDMPRVKGLVEIVDARFVFREFPYPFRGARGKIAFGRDPFSGQDYVSVIDMRGHGIVGGPNEHGEVAVSGRVGPLGPGLPEPGIDLRATGTDISSEPQLMAAMPPEVKEALGIFDAPGKGEFPQFKGNFVCAVRRKPGPRQRLSFVTDLDLHDCSGIIKGFPYPLKHVSGKVRVHDNYVEVLSARMHEGPASALVAGNVRWADETGRNQPIDIDLNVSVNSFGINKDLIAAIPEEQNQWLTKLGLGGTLDVQGRIFTKVPTDWRTRYPRGQKIPDPDVLYDLSIAVRDGTIWPVDGLFSIGSVGGKLYLTRDRLDVLELHGRRESAELSGAGVFVFSGPSPRMEVHGAARNLAMDQPLYAMLPAEGRKSWDEVRPEGTVDADIEYRRPLMPAPKPIETSQASLDSGSGAGDEFHAVLRPRHLSVRVKTAPYPLTFEHGSVTITPGRAVLSDLLGTHGKATLRISGAGQLGASRTWDLKLRADDLAVNDEFRRAMPQALLAILDGVKLRGTVGFDFSKLLYRSSVGTVDPDIDVGGVVALKNAGAELGMPMADILGRITFTAAVRQGKFDNLDGRLAIDSMTLGGRPLRGLDLRMLKPAGRPELHVDKVAAKFAGGELAGDAVIRFPDQGANRYTTNLVLRNADVRELTGDMDPNIRGELTASLALEGSWGESAARRGRGDVVIAGKQLYRIPLMLGLMQVTNLSLPVGQPFTKGIARYTVEGTRVNFEQMDLSAKGLTVSGSGYLDFGTHQVRLTLTTDNPDAFKVPFLSDLWQGARQELLKISIRGTIQDPKVQPTSMGIFTTTIDQVFKGDTPRK